MSARTEYVEASYGRATTASVPLKLETLAILSFGLCLAVFLGALVLVCLRSSESLYKSSLIPLDRQPEEKPS